MLLLVDGQLGPGRAEVGHVPGVCSCVRQPLGWLRCAVGVFKGTTAFDSVSPGSDSCGKVNVS